MIGIRFRDVAGTGHAFAVDGTQFDDSLAEVEDWIDLRHLWSVPGLADCHAHLAARDIQEMVDGVPDEDARIAESVRSQLDGGVLLVADKGSRSDDNLQVLDWPGDRRPEMHMAGRILAPADGYYPEFEIDVSASDLPGAVETACATAASWVKLIGDWPRKGVGAIPNYAEGELASAVEVAHRHGRRVAIHTTAPDTPSLAVAAGVDSIEHGLYLTPEDLRVLGERGGAWVPTVVAMEAICEMLGPDSTGGKLFSHGLENVRQLLPEAAGAGVQVLAGTDLHLEHGRVAQEAVALCRYGLTESEALAAVTTNAYDYLDSSRGFASGLIADLVAFNVNPCDDIAALSTPQVIMRAGRTVRS